MSMTCQDPETCTARARHQARTQPGRTRVPQVTHTNTHTHVHAHVHGGRKGLITRLPQTRTLAHIRKHTQTPSRSSCQRSELGAGRVPFRHRDTAPLPAPWGPLQMPGVILSLDQWAIFGDTGLGGQAEEPRDGCSGTLLRRKTPGSREGSLGQGVTP